MAVSEDKPQHGAQGRGQVATGLLSPPLGLTRRPLSCPVLCAAFPLTPRPSGSSLPHQSTLPFRFQPTVLSSGKPALGHPAAPHPLGEAPLKALGAQDTSLLALAAASYVCVMLSRAYTSHEGKNHVPGLAVPRTHPLPCKEGPGSARPPQAQQAFCSSEPQVKCAGTDTGDPPQGQPVA